MCGFPEYPHNISTPAKTYLVKTPTGEVIYDTHHEADGCTGELDHHDVTWSGSSEYDATDDNCTGPISTILPDPGGLLEASLNDYTAAGCPGRLDIFIFTPTTARFNTGCCDLLNILSSTAFEELTIEDSEEAAVARLLATSEWTDWDEAADIDSFCVMAQCCTALNQDRSIDGPHYSKDYMEAQWRVSRNGLAPSTSRDIEVDFYRRVFGSGDDWVLYATVTYSGTTDGTGLLEISGDVPNAPNYETRAAAYRLV